MLTKIAQFPARATVRGRYRSNLDQRHRSQARATGGAEEATTAPAGKPRSENHRARTRSARERSLSRLLAAAAHERWRWASFWSCYVYLMTRASREQSQAGRSRTERVIASSAERTFCRWYFVLRSRIDDNSCSQSAGQPFKA